MSDTDIRGPLPPTQRFEALNAAARVFSSGRLGRSSALPLDGEGARGAHAAVVLPNRRPHRIQHRRELPLHVPRLDAQRTHPMRREVRVPLPVLRLAPSMSRTVDLHREPRVVCIEVDDDIGKVTCRLNLTPNCRPEAPATRCAPRACESAESAARRA